MFKLKLSVFVLFLSMMILSISSCSILQSNLTPNQRYYAALKAFDDNVEDYLAMYKVAPAETQAKWKKNIDPVIKQANTALKAWKQALGTSEEASQEKVWMEVKDQLLAALFQYGIIQME